MNPVKPATQQLVNSFDQHERNIVNLGKCSAKGTSCIYRLTVKAATLIFISGRDSAISSAKEGKAGFIYNLVKSK